MSQKRLSMRKIRELLRLKYEVGRSHREIATSLGIANSTVSDYVRRASAGGFSWPLPEGLDDAALEAALFPAPPPSRVPRPEPNWEDVHRELQRHKGVTLQLLWLEYRTVHANGYGYSWFCERYRAWRGRIDVVMRQVYRAGEKAFVDYAGPKFEVVDRETGEARDIMVFVGVLGASNHTFVDVTRSRSLPDWTMSHVRMFEFWGGVPELVIPDNEKAAVHKASRYEPDLNPTYQELATHYGTAVLPARPRAPRDKAKAETAVQHVERWVMAPLRNHTFFSLRELREAIAPLLAALNERPFDKTEGSRRSWFEDLDRPALKPLPDERYEYAEWRKARVNIDYHIQVEHALYSVPHPLGRCEVDVRITAQTVEIFHKYRRVAAHLRIHGRGGYAMLASGLQGRIVGSVLDTLRAGLPGARVFVERTGIRSLTDREGGFELNWLDPGTYAVNFTHPYLEAFGYVSEPVEVEVDADAETPVEVHFSAPSVAWIVDHMCRDEARPEPLVVGGVEFPMEGVGLDELDANELRTRQYPMVIPTGEHIGRLDLRLRPGD